MPGQLAANSDYGPLSQEDWFSSFEIKLDIYVHMVLGDLDI